MRIRGTQAEMEESPRRFMDSLKKDKANLSAVARRMEVSKSPRVHAGYFLLYALELTPSILKEYVGCLSELELKTRL